MVRFLAISKFLIYPHLLTILIISLFNNSLFGLHFNDWLAFIVLNIPPIITLFAILVYYRNLSFHDYELKLALNITNIIVSSLVIIITWFAMNFSFYTPFQPRELVRLLIVGSIPIYVVVVNFFDLLTLNERYIEDFQKIVLDYDVYDVNKLVDRIGMVGGSTFGPIADSFKRILILTSNKIMEIEQNQIQFKFDILENLDMEVYSFKPNGEIEYVNHVVAKDLDFRNFLLGKTDLDFTNYLSMDKKIAEKRMQILKASVKSKQALVYNEDWIDTEGNEHYNLYRVCPVMDKSDQVSRVIRFGINTSKQRIREIDLTAKITNFENIFNLNNIGTIEFDLSAVNQKLNLRKHQSSLTLDELTIIYDTNLDYLRKLLKITYISDFTLRLFGNDRGESAISFLLRQLTNEYLYSWLSSYVNNKKSHQFEILLQTLNNEKFPAMIQTAFPEVGSINSFALMSLRDVTSVKVIENEMAQLTRVLDNEEPQSESNEFARYISIHSKIPLNFLNAAPIGILLSRDGIIIYSNNYASNLFGLDHEQIEEKQRSELVNPHEVSKYEENLKMILNGQKNTVTFDLINKSDSFEKLYTIVNMFKIPLLNGYAVCEILTNVTQISIRSKEQDDEINALKEKNKELENFVSIASHDLKEPIRKIHSFNQLLEESLEGNLTEEQRSYFQFIISGTKRMNQVLTNLLIYTKLSLDEAKFTPVDLNELVSDLLNFELSELISQKNAEFIITNSLPVIFGNRGQLYQLFQNIFSNAMKFSNLDEHPLIIIQSSSTANKHKISIIDNGIGISDTDKTKVFQMFTRLNSTAVYPGTGIGLSICKKIIEFHNGSITIADSEPQGTTFHIEFPTSNTQEN